MSCAKRFWLWNNSKITCYTRDGQYNAPACVFQDFAEVKYRKTRVWNNGIGLKKGILMIFLGGEFELPTLINIKKKKKLLIKNLPVLKL